MPAMRVRVTFGAIWAVAEARRREHPTALSKAEFRRARPAAEPQARKTEIEEKDFIGERESEAYLAARSAGSGRAGARAMNQPVVLWSSLK